MDEKKDSGEGYKLNYKHYRQHWVFGLGMLVLAVVIFAAGLFAGGHGRRNEGAGFKDTRQGGFGLMTKGMPFKGLEAGHQIQMKQSGTTGTISSISTNVIALNASNGVSQEVVVSGQTKITKNNSDIKLGDLKVNDRITIYGRINVSGQIEAMLIQAQ